MSEAGRVTVKIVADDKDLRSTLQGSQNLIQEFGAQGADAGKTLGEGVSRGAEEVKVGTQAAIDKIREFGLTVIRNTDPIVWGFKSAKASLAELPQQAQLAEDSVLRIKPAADSAATGLSGIQPTIPIISELGSKADLTRALLEGMREEINKLLAEMGAVGTGAVEFKTLQQGIDESLGLVSREINSASTSARVFAKDFKTTADSVEDDMKRLGRDSTQMQQEVSVRFRTLQQNIDQSLGLVDRPLLHASDSARAFENSFLSSTPVIDEMRDQVGNKLPGSLDQFTHATTRATHIWGTLAGSLFPSAFMQVPGQLVNIAAQFEGINYALFAGVGAAFAFVAGISYLAYESYRASEAMKEIELNSAVAGNISITSDVTEDLIENLSHLKLASKEDIRAVAGYFADLRNVGVDAYVGMSTAAVMWAQATRSKTEDVGKAFGNIIDSEKTSLKELEAVFGHVTLEQLRNVQAAQAVGDRGEIVNAVLAIAYSRLNEVRDATIHLNLGYNDLQEKLPAVKTLIDTVTRAWEANMASIFNVMTAQHLYIDNSAEILRQGRLVADSISTPSERLGKLLTDQKKLMDAMAEAPKKLKGKELEAEMSMFGDRMKQLNQDIKHAREAIGREEFDDFVRNVNLKRSVSKRGTEEDLAGLKLIADEAKRRWGEASDTYQQYMTMYNQRKTMVDAKGELAGGRDVISEMKQRISEINANEALGVAERGKLIRQEYENILASGKLTAQQRIQIQTEMNNALAANERAAKAEHNKIQQDDLNTEMRLAQIRMRLESSLLQLAVGEKQAATADKLRLDLQFARETGELQQRMLEKEQEGYREGSIEFLRVENQKRVAKAETAAEIERINAQIAADERKTAREYGNVWASTTDAILQAERSLLSDMLGGRVTFMQALGRLTLQFLQRELEMDIAYYTKKALLSDADWAIEEAKTQKGILVHLLGETKKTAATVTGGQARVAAQALAESEGTAVQAAAGSKRILNHAYEAAAGAYDAVVGIPVVGPVLAPIAAGAAFVAVSAFDMLTGLDVGAWNVPRDMPAMIHAGETVVPKTFAEGLRATGSINPVIPRVSGEGIRASGMTVNNSSGSGNTTNSLTYSPHINAPQHKSLEQLINEDSRALRTWFAHQVRLGAIKLPAAVG